MDSLLTSDPISVIRYLREEAPGELESLESIDRLVELGPDWGLARPSLRHSAHSARLRMVHGMFHRRAGIDGAACVQGPALCANWSAGGGDRQGRPPVLPHR
jgi:hypothetical protein